MKPTKIALLELRNTYAFCDPAGGKRSNELKRARARSAIVVVSQDDLGRKFVRKAWAKRCTTSELVDEIFATHKEFQVEVFGVEKNAMQVLFSDMLSREAFLTGRELPIAPYHQPTNVEKTWRIRSILQPQFRAGKIFYREDMDDLRAELIGAPLSPMRDLIDALASCVDMLPPPISRREQDTELSDRLSYLRSIGAPPDYIEAISEGRNPPDGWESSYDTLDDFS